MDGIEIPSGEVAQQSLTLLCVDDEPHILSALRRLFRKSGYRVLYATSGAEGLELLEREAVDMVISDMRMQKMDGARFLEAVRARWPETIRILMTGYADISSTIDAINKGGIYHYIAKPWDDDELLELVRQAFERRRLAALVQHQNEELKNINGELAAAVRERSAELQQAREAIDSLKGMQEQADYLARHDTLTGLPNRLLLAERIGHAIELAKRRQYKLGIFFIDLDHFKQVNDRLGHAAGDALLQDVASAMQRILRKEDTLARLGGDEFVLLVEDVKSEETALTIAQKLLGVFPRQVGGDGIEIAVTASIGVSFYPRDGISAAELLEGADGAMYRVKAGGRAGLSLCQGAKGKNPLGTDTLSVTN